MDIIFVLMPIVFVMGIICISLEDKLKIDKGAVSIIMSIVLWVLLVIGGERLLVDHGNAAFTGYLQNHPDVASMPLSEQIRLYLTNHAFVYHLGDVSETLFFVMGSMMIINIVDRHGGFRVITDRLLTNNKRKVLWYFVFLSFFLSALLDNLAAALVLLAILRKMVPDKTDRMKYACMIVIGCNAGGSWSPIGDVTTLLLWTGGNITAMHQITRLFVPALVNLLAPTLVAHYWLFHKGAVLRESSQLQEDPSLQYITKRQRWVILSLGIASLVLVPVFQSVTGLPPFLLVIMGMAVLWIYTDLMHSEAQDKYEENLRVARLFRNLNLNTIFFFLGILMSVAALETGGQLARASGFLDRHISSPRLIAGLIGVASSFTDNVALVAGTMGMYPLDSPADIAGAFAPDGAFWLWTAYAAVTGGSLLIIGSATGVTVMGLEKISFAYYFKRFSILALLGYLSGLGVLLLENYLTL